MPFKIIHSVFILFTLLFTQNISATPSQIALEPLLYYFDYAEFNLANQELNNETGMLPGVRASILFPEGLDHIEAHIQLLDNQIDYTGQTQSGSPHKTRTNEQLLNIGFRLLPHQLNFYSYQFFLGFEHWKWDRDILTKNNVIGLHEIYFWDELNAGLQYTLTRTNESSFWIEVSGFYILSPRMELLLPTSREKLNLGSDPGIRFKTGKSWNANQQLGFALALMVEYRTFGRSNTILVGDFFGRTALITEPRSETIITGLELSLYF